MKTTAFDVAMLPVCLLCGYLAIAFMGWSFDPGDWDMVGRFLALVVGVVSWMLYRLIKVGEM